MVRAMCGVQLKGRKRSTDLMLGLNETIDQLAMVNSVCCHGHFLRREDGHDLRTLDIAVEGQRKKGRPKRTWKRQVAEESMKVALRGKDTLSIELECWSCGQSIMFIFKTKCEENKQCIIKQIYQTCI